MVLQFRSEWDEYGVYFYQAFNCKIANWALKNQKFGGPDYKTTRMTWIKPSLAWMLYRSGYASKDINQNRILKIKVPHHIVAQLLTSCSLGHGGGGTDGRVQWDPYRTIYYSDPDYKYPEKKPSKRAIQIGLKGSLCKLFNDNILEIEDVTALAKQIQAIHCNSTLTSLQQKQQIKGLAELPNERLYIPHCSFNVLKYLNLV